MTDTRLAAEAALRDAEIRITALRTLILSTVMQHDEDVFTLAELAALLPTVDESTLFRTMTLLAERHVVHAIDDGSGLAKYCLCHCPAHDHTHGHIHLTCTRCHHTYCLHDVAIPPVVLPVGFVAEEAEYVVKGICPKCNR